MGVCGLAQTVMGAPLSGALNGPRIFVQTLFAGKTLMGASQKLTLNWRQLSCMKLVSHLCVCPPDGTPQPLGQITAQL